MTEQSLSHTPRPVDKSAASACKPPTLTGQYHSLTVYTFHCGRCGKTLDGEFGPVWFSGEHPVEDYDDLDAMNWQEVRGKWVCPDCWHWCRRPGDGSDRGFGPQEGCCDGL